MQDLKQRIQLIRKLIKIIEFSVNQIDARNLHQMLEGYMITLLYHGTVSMWKHCNGCCLETFSLA